MNKTCNLPPESRVEGIGLATFVARRVRKVLTPAFLVGVVLSVPSSAQTKFSIVGKTPITLPFELVDNRVFVEVLLDGRGPLHFILDTGAGGFCLTDTAAQKLDLHVAESGQGTRRGRKDRARRKDAHSPSRSLAMAVQNMERNHDRQKDRSQKR